MDVINRGSCPPAIRERSATGGGALPANLARATKPALIDELQRRLAELAEVDELLLAIAETARADDPDDAGAWPGAWAVRQLGRIGGAAEHATTRHEYGALARQLRALLADDKA